MNVLIVKTSSMGDVIHTLPALTDAQRAIPDIQFDWVVEENFAEIPRWHSAVSTVIPVAIRRWRKRLLSWQTLQEWRAYKKALKAKHYDAVIDAQGLLKSAALVTRLAKGEKFGYDKHSAREGLSHFFYDKTFAISYQQHAVERIRQLFAKSLGYELPLTMGDYAIASNFVKKSTKSTACKPYVMAIHATTQTKKHWREDYWIALFRKLEDRDLMVHLPWGNEEEKARAERLVSHCPNAIMLPKMSLSALAEQIANAKAVVSVDTGLSHLSAALDKPNVVLYGATDPKLIGAYGKHQVHLKGHSMESLMPYRVLQALDNISTE